VTIQPATPTAPSTGVVTVNVSPVSPSVQSGQVQQFAATVTGTTNTAVTWSAGLGSISSSGLYTAPSVKTAAMDTVSATSVASTNVSKAVSVTVTLVPTPAPTPTSTAPVVGGAYISPDGSDSNPGTEAKPWLTFAHAIPLLVPGSTLVLENGTYTGSNSGYPNINCSTTAHNGTSGSPITVIAQNQRQAWIDSDGTPATGPFQISNCSYWTISGLHITDADSTSESAENATLSVVSGNHIQLLYNLIDHTNRCENEQAVALLYNTSNTLVQDNEVYYFHRIAFYDYSNSNTASTRNELTQNYANSRSYATIACYTPGSAVSFSAYGANYTLLENNISEGSNGVTVASEGFDTEVVTGQSGVGNMGFLGNISYQDVIGFIGEPHENVAGRGISNNTYLNSAIINPVEIGQYMRGLTNTTISNMSMFSTTATDGNFVQDNNGMSLWTPSTTITNSEISTGTRAAGYAAAMGTVTASYFGAFGASTFSSGSVTSSNQFNTNPAFGSCYLWVPAGSPAKGSGSGGADIGATVLYAYQAGVLTATPLWNSSGQFASQGAVVAGINDVAGSSLFDVGTRLNVNQNGCSFPSTYTPNP
jgi:hypothetical protein